MQKDELELAEKLSGQAAEFFAQARMEAPVANALGKAQEAWSAALAAADRDLLRKYAHQTVDAAQEKAASAATFVTAGKPEEATTFFRDARDMLDRADESLMPQLQIAISSRDRLRATELLAKIEGLTPGDPRLPDLRKKVEAVPHWAIAPFDGQQAKQYQRAWAENLGVPINTTNSIGMRLLLVPPGEFQMGSPASDRDTSSYEKPQHKVRITKAFYLGVSEVSQEQYERVMGHNPSQFKGDPQRPVENVSWEDAVEFCQELSEQEGVMYRLPTEAEWEYACRAGTTTRYCFGDDQARLGEYAWYNRNSHVKTHPVGGRRPNAWGLCDMHGNVGEPCADWYDVDYYANSTRSDPTGPESGSYRVFRGGSWSFGSGNCRSAGRSWHSPEVRGNLLGFRVARNRSGR